MPAKFVALKKCVYIALILFLPFLAISAHGDRNKNTSKTLSGKVTDAYGEALPGAKIKVKETGETFFANFEGQFKLSLQTDKTYSLVFETIGFEPVEVKSTELGLFSELSLKSL